MRLALLLFALSCCSAQTEAEKLIEAGHWKQARATLAANPRQYDDALTQFLQSQIRNAFGDHESPLPLAEKAVAIDPKVPKYHRQVAEALGVMAQHAGIFQQLLLVRRFRHEIDAALALDPRDLQALRDLMEYYLLAPAIAGGDKSKARDTADRIARIDPVQGYLAQARLAEAAGEPARQEDALRKAVEAGPASYRAHVALATCLVSHGNWDAARDQAELARRIDDTRVDAYSVLATVYAHSGQVSALEGLLTAAEKKVPDDSSPYYRATEGLLAVGRDLGRAQQYLNRYLSIDPEGNAPTRADARGKLGEVLAKTKAISAMSANAGPR
jgi:tetratricopeptide (TPR) repeat protein